MKTARVTGFEITKNKNSSGKKLLLQCEISGPDDIQSIELRQSAGENSPPPENSRVVFDLIGSNGYKIAFAVDDNIEPPAVEAGEKVLYSSDGGAVKSTVKLLKDGSIEINGNDDFAVAFNNLKSGFDQLKSDFNSFLTHVHGASGTPPAPPAIPSTASIDSSKIDLVKVGL